MSNYSENIYIHQNFNKNQIKSVLLENATHSTRPEPISGEDKGLLYFDTDINRIIVWDGNSWKIVRYFDDRDVTNTEDVQMQDIWAQSGQLSILTESEAKGASQSIVEYFSDENTTHIPGSWSFHTEKMKNIVFPRIFNNGGASYPEFYRAVLKNHFGVIIDTDEYLINKYKLNDGSSQYRIEFKDGKKMNQLGVSTDNPPNISFYNYIGDSLSLTFIGGLIKKIIKTGEDFEEDIINPDSVRCLLVGTNINTISEIQFLTINGQELIPDEHYKVYENSGNIYLSIDLSNSGTGWLKSGQDVEDVLVDKDSIIITSNS